MNGDDLEWKFSHVHTLVKEILGERGGGHKILFLFNQSTENLILSNISKNQFSMSIRGEDIQGIPSQ